MKHARWVRALVTPTSLVGLATMLLVVSPSGQSRAPRLDTVDLLGRYDRGEYESVFTALTAPGAAHALPIADFQKDAERWIRQASPDQRWHRTLVASTIALEVAHALRIGAMAQPARFIAWASQRMRDSPPAETSEAERLWYLAALAGLEELESPWELATNITEGHPNAGGQQRELEPLLRALDPGGLAALAAKRFPAEPRFALARALGLEWPINYFEFRHSSYQSFERWEARQREGRADRQQLGRPTGRGGAEDVYWGGITWLRGRLARAEEALLALPSDPTIAPEVQLHLGALDHVASRWASSLDRCQRVLSLTNDAYLRYLAEYFTGRTFQELGDHARAREALERALRIVPNAASAATHLATELLASDRREDRDRAHGLLQSAYADNAPIDPWVLYARGDARLWPTYMAYLRQAMR